MKTPLYQNHLDLTAKIVPFASWEMPLYYSSIQQEVRAVRNTCGMFDVSHMGRISLSGPQVMPFLDYVSANGIAGKTYKKAFYTVLCNEKGGVIDDVLVYLLDQDRAFLVVNASNREKDLRHLKKEAEAFEVQVQDHFEGEGILSLQGPESRLVSEVTLKPFEVAVLKNGLVVSRTGYTGEEGYEFYGPQEKIVELWNHFLKKQVLPCGLGARDVLRQEMGYALYGHELSEEISVLESVAKWVVKFNHDFLGKKALEPISAAHLRVPVALIGDKAPAREGYKIYDQDQEVGVITSGTFSPTLKRPIALGLVKKSFKENDLLDVLIRSQYHPFQVVKLPFIAR